jgi:hypothetical protein
MSSGSGLHAPRGAGNPPKPFILGASGESAANKFYRLGEQLRWAFDQGMLTEAITWLDGCPSDKWETHDPERWGESFYPNFDDASDGQGDDLH